MCRRASGLRGRRALVVRLRPLGAFRPWVGFVVRLRLVLVGLQRVQGRGVVEIPLCTYVCQHHQKVKPRSSEILYCVCQYCKLPSHHTWRRALRELLWIFSPISASQISSLQLTVNLGRVPFGIRHRGKKPYVQTGLDYGVCPK